MEATINHCPRKGSVWGFSPTGPFFCAGFAGVRSWYVCILLLALMALGGCRSDEKSAGPVVASGADTTVEAKPATASKNSVKSDRSEAQSSNATTSTAVESRDDAPVVVSKERPAEVVGKEEEPAPESDSKLVTPFPGIRVKVKEKYVELDGETCYDLSWLEFVACSPNTKEHESLVMMTQRPSNIHAAMLLAGFESGEPGKWTYENKKFELIPPKGSKLKIEVRYTDRSGKTVTRNVCDWIRDHLGKHKFPCRPWVFGGSAIEPNPEFMGEGEHYVADMTGSIIGLATFSDEVIGYSDVFSPDADVHVPEWEANNSVMPEGGTKVTVIVREWGE